MAAQNQRTIDAAEAGRLLVSTPGQAWRTAQLAAAMQVPAWRARNAVSLLRASGALVPEPNIGRFNAGVTARPGWKPAPIALPAPEAPQAEPRMSARWMRELLDLHQVSFERALTHEESERLGVLIQREQRSAPHRPAMMARLRETLALLETLEMASRGTVAEGSAKAEPVDLQPSGDGTWQASERRAA